MKMIRLLALALALAAALPMATNAKPSMPTCKGATVYAVASMKTYYMKGETKYGHVKGGTYMCQAAANAKGYSHAKS